MIGIFFDEKLFIAIFRLIDELVFLSMQFIKEEINDFQNNIFHLSILLFQLLTGKCYIKKYESQFLIIILSEKISFCWKSIEFINNQTFSKKIKNIIYKMLEVKDFNIDFDAILNDNNYWFKNVSINNFNNYIKNEFNNLEIN